MSAPPTLQDLVQRAQWATEKMSVRNPNRTLLKEMAIALVSLARMNADLVAQQAEKPRIIVP